MSNEEEFGENILKTITANKNDVNIEQLAVLKSKNWLDFQVSNEKVIIKAPKSFWENEFTLEGKKDHPLCPTGYFLGICSFIQVNRMYKWLIVTENRLVKKGPNKRTSDNRTEGALKLLGIKIVSDPTNREKELFFFPDNCWKECEKFLLAIGKKLIKTQ